MAARTADDDVKVTAASAACSVRLRFAAGGRVRMCRGVGMKGISVSPVHTTRACCHLSPRGRRTVLFTHTPKYPMRAHLCLLLLLQLDACVTHRAARRAVLRSASAAATSTFASPAFAVAYRDEPFGVTAQPKMPRQAKAKCRDIESCREEGERRAEEAEARAGPLRSVGPVGANGLGRVRYRAMKETDYGPPLKHGDTAEIRFDVAKTGGDYMYSVPSREPGAAEREVLDTYRLVLGNRDVPLGVELALEGAHQGDLRRIEVPPDLGFETSDWRPTPTGFSGKQRLERYRMLLTGNGLQPGYNASILFQVEVVRVRPASSSGA